MVVTKCVKLVFVMEMRDLAVPSESLERPNNVSCGCIIVRVTHWMLKLSLMCVRRRRCGGTVTQAAITHLVALDQALVTCGGDGIVKLWPYNKSTKNT